MSLVSIIVPVYNVEKYLSQCVDSILAQTYHNLEVILVDDGSTDGSGEICEEYTKLDSRVLCIHKDNGGPGEARNFGVNQAHGEYLAFMDSDDYISHHFIDVMISLLKQEKIDIAMLRGGIGFWDGKKEPELAHDAYEYKVSVMTSDEALKLQLEQNIATGAPWRVVCRDMYDGIKFPSTLFAEDLATTYKLFLKAKNVAVVDGSFYAYRKHMDSIVRQPISKKKMNGVIKVARELIEDIGTVRPDLRPYAVSRGFAMLYSVFLQVPQTYIAESKEIWSVLCTYRREIIRNSNKITRRKNVYGAYAMFLGRRMAYLIGREFGQYGSMK